jgi:hypothetical protein
MDLVRHGVNGWLFPSGRPTPGLVVELSADAKARARRRPGGVE